MAGHSHAKNVKRRKDAVNKVKSAAFARASRLIISAVREGGKDPKGNPTLRTAIENAKEVDMPKENIERAIKRGSGEGDEGQLQSFTFEAYGPENTAFIIQGSTDNRNRTVGEIKEILKDNNGKLADPGSVKWLFSQKGVVEVEENTLDEDTILSLIENGVEDVIEELSIIYTPPEKLEDVKKILTEKNKNITSASLGWKANSPLSTENSSAKKLIDELQNNEAVENVFTNL